MDDLERQLMNYDEMGTSIAKIQNPGVENKELFRDLNTFSKEGSTCGNTMAGKNFDMNNFVQDLENNLDNFDNVDEPFGPKPSNIDTDFSKRKESFTENLVSIEDGDPQPEPEQEEEEKKDGLLDYDTWNEVIYEFLVKVKEPLIIVLLFILLNNRDFIALTYQLPFMNLTDSPYPSLIIRGTILALIIYYLRKMDKK